jgi:threonylcarbamoyladenosine tRNA methylthiotransferase MtaB
MKKAALHTLGCKLNFSETSTIGKQFIDRGFNIVDIKESADVYLFNTCTVTENAEKECRQLVRRVLRQNPEAYIIVTGCYAQLRPDEIASIEGVDAVLGSNEKFKLFTLLKDFDKKNLACTFVSPLQELNEFGFAASGEGDTRTRAYFKIQDGCDYKCSFCTIPLARGTSRSMEPETAVTEFRKIVEAGYKEIILTGVNVGDYGKSFDSDLYNLLLKFIQVEGDFRIRISSVEPNLLSDEIIELAASSSKICRHFHIPLQSGSPAILQAMQRRYKVSDYEHLIARIKNRIPDAGIGVDIIVGFPGETESEFLKTHNFLKDLPISYLHVFTYSERPDTKAINMKGRVEVSERKRRNNILRILSQKKKHLFYESSLGRTAEVLFEAETSDGLMKGFSSEYIRLALPVNESYVNSITPVEILSVEDEYCTGRILEKKKSIDLLAG